MVGAMRAVSVMRGIDPRDYTVIVGGGAGGTHAAKIAEELAIRRVICPQVAGGLCAFGMLVADVRHTYLVTDPTSTVRFDPVRINEVFGRMEEQAVAELEAQGFTSDQIVLTRTADAKYPYQINEIMIPVPDGDLSADHASAIATAFHDEHERLYTYCVRDMAVDLNAWRVIATGRLPELPLDQTGRQEPVGVLKETRNVFFSEANGYVETPIFDGEALAIGTTIDGPAIAELPTTTLVVFPGHQLVVDDGGNSVITIPGLRRERHRADQLKG